MRLGEIIRTWPTLSERDRAVWLGWATAAPFTVVLPYAVIAATIMSVTGTFPWYLGCGLPLQACNVPLTIMNFIMQGAFLAWFILLFIVYWRHVQQNTEIHEGYLTSWFLGFLIGNFYAMAHYWYRYLWPVVKAGKG